VQKIHQQFAQLFEEDFKAITILFITFVERN
jgi:hypothetical protein